MFHLNLYFQRFYEIVIRIISGFFKNLLISCPHIQTEFVSLIVITLILQFGTHSSSLRLEIVFVSQISSDEDYEDSAMICLAVYLAAHFGTN